MYGGKVQLHPDSSNVAHLLRGEVYEIDGKTFFAFGGAASIDKMWRTPGYSWWESEEATNEQIENAFHNLKKYDYKVDYVLTHTMPNSLIAMQGFKPISDRTAQFLDTIYNNGNGKDEYGGIDFTEWFCEHFHENKQMAPRVNCLYSDYKVILSEKIREAEVDCNQLEYE